MSDELKEETTVCPMCNGQIYVWKDRISDQLKALSEFYPASQWIPVGERLPENANDCAVLIDGRRDWGWYNEASKGWRKGAQPLEGVTHYFLIPTPPKDKSK